MSIDNLVKIPASIGGDVFSSPQVFWGEDVSYNSQLFQSLQKPETWTVVSLVDKTRWLILSWLNADEIHTSFPSLPPFISSWANITDHNIVRFPASKFLQEILTKTPEYTVMIGNTGQNPRDIIEPALLALPVERTVPPDLVSQVMELLRKEHGINIADYPVDEQSRAMLKIRFQSQHLRHDGKILVKLDHTPGNRLAGYVYPVQSELEIENEYLRAASNSHFFWADQRLYFHLFQK